MAETSISPLLADFAREEERRARQAAEEAASPLRERGVAVVVRVRRGNPGDAILEQAREDGAHLIVVGSHGKGAVQRLLVGSVSERVARYAHCSVLVARGDFLRQAVVAFDGSESAAEALDAYARLPLPADLATAVVRVVPTSGIPLPVPIAPGVTYAAPVEADEREWRTAAEALLRRAQERLRAAGRASATAVRFGAPADELVAHARETGADLIVVGAANRSALGRLLLGSVSARVLSHAPCSVLVARSAGWNEPDRV
jgi:nucleotide-binding universal stress UspA family protein